MNPAGWQPKPPDPSAKPKQKVKVVVRNLPITLAAADFKTLMKKYIDKVDYFDYMQGKKSGPRQIPSRAWLHFTDLDTMYSFAEEFDGHTFLDARGLPVVCSVEYAQYQHYGHTLNGNKTKLDSRDNTFEQDEYFIKFAQDLKNPPPPPKEELPPPAPNVHDMKTPLSTPILDDLRRKAAAKLEQQNLRKQKKELAKQRAGARPPQGQPGEAGPAKSSRGGGGYKPRGAGPGGNAKATKPRYAPKPVVQVK